MSRKLLLGVVAASGWFAIISQYYLILQNDSRSFLDTTINFLSYFTILTNLLMAVHVTRLLMGQESSQKINAAIAVYITVVGVTYNLILRFIWAPQGLQRVTDELLHLVNPLLFVIFWLVFNDKDQLKWRDAFTWLIYPFVYSVYTLIHGVISNWYPYPFIDPNTIGWSQVAINSLFVLIAFLVVSFLAIAIGRLRNRTV